MAFESLGHDTPKEDLDALADLCGRCHRWPGAELEIIEVGSFVGRTALVLAKFGLVHCVDTWQGSPADRVGEIVEKHSPAEVFRTFCRNAGELLFVNVWPHISTSLLMASVWPRPVDLIFIDADHRYPQVKADIEAWSKHVRPGGILCGHDYRVFEGVTRAADECGIDGVVGRTVWWKQM